MFISKKNGKNKLKVDIDIFDKIKKGGFIYIIKFTLIHT